MITQKHYFQNKKNGRFKGLKIIVKMKDFHKPEMAAQLKNSILGSYNENCVIVRLTI